MDTQPPVETGPGRSEEFITIKVPKDALPVGLMPPTFDADYVVGAVAPFLLSDSYVDETPSLPMIDLARLHETSASLSS